MNIGEIIKKCRVARNLTQEDMANALNITPQAVSRWETGISYPDISMIPHVCKYLNVSADKLLGCENNEITNSQEVLNQSQIDSIFDYVPIEKTSGKRVLIVDDATFMRKMLSELLTADGNFVIQAENGQECIDRLETEQIDICILDINMPVMNGTQALEIIRKKYPKLKIIILTIQSTEETVRRTLSLGADGFVAKPFAPNSILERMC